MTTKRTEPAPTAAQASLPATIDASTAIQHTQAQIEHELSTRAAEEARRSEVLRRADAEVSSWTVQPAAPPPAPAPAPSPADQPPSVPPSRAAAAPEDGPGPLNNQGQRVPVSFDPQNADEMYRYAQMLARSTLLPRAFYDRDDKEKRHARIGDVHFVLMKGKALGLHPMVSIGNINIIDGKAEVGALLMLSIVRRSGLMTPGGWKLVHSDAQRAVFATRRVDEDWTQFEYTIEEADQMGLLDKGRDEWAKANNQWRKQPRTMLRRRCQSMLLREVYPDAVLGLYDHDELAEMRERERALGIDPDRVIDAVSAQSLAQLSAPPGPGAIASLAQRQGAAPADPLKARLAARQVERAAPPIANEHDVEPDRSCSKCGAPLDERDADPCIGCR